MGIDNGGTDGDAVNIAAAFIHDLAAFQAGMDHGSVVLLIFSSVYFLRFDPLMTALSLSISMLARLLDEFNQREPCRACLSCLHRSWWN